MKFRWQKLLTKITLWLGMEILLNMMGLDDLADYTEFLGNNKRLTSIGVVYPTLTVSFQF